MHGPESVDELCTNGSKSVRNNDGKAFRSSFIPRTDTFMGTKSVELKAIFSASTTTAERCYRSGRAYKRIVVSEFLST